MQKNFTLSVLNIIQPKVRKPFMGFRINRTSFKACYKYGRFKIRDIQSYQGYAVL